LFSSIAMLWYSSHRRLLGSETFGIVSRRTGLLSTLGYVDLFVSIDAGSVMAIWMHIHLTFISADTAVTYTSCEMENTCCEH
jgi:hypothetical protein